MNDIINESRHAATFVLHEGDMNYCRDEIVVAPEQSIVVGAVLGKRAAGAVTINAPVQSGTGNGVMTLADPPYGAGVKEGDYLVKCTTPAGGGGTFTIYLPDGSTEGTVAVGAPYDGTIKFTIADGTPDFDTTSQFVVRAHIAGTRGEYLPYDPSASDGAETVAGIAIYPAVTAAGETDEIAALVRGPAGVIASDLTWFDGATSEEIATGVTGLMALKIRAR